MTSTLLRTYGASSKRRFVRVNGSIVPNKQLWGRQLWHPRITRFSLLAMITTLILVASCFLLLLGSIRSWMKNFLSCPIFRARSCDYFLGWEEKQDSWKTQTFSILKAMLHTLLVCTWHMVTSPKHKRHHNLTQQSAFWHLTEADYGHLLESSSGSSPNLAGQVEKLGVVIDTDTFFFPKHIQQKR